MALRKPSTLLFLFFLCITAFFFFSSTASSPGANLAENVSKATRFTGKIPTFDIPDLRFSFQSSSHKPPVQKNSTSGDASWYTDWKWMNPFSSSVTLDEDRVVLPPLPERPPVYTYYDVNPTKDKDTLHVDGQLLKTWQRSWWAHGFRPVILSHAEAMENPLYQNLQGKGMPAALEFEFSRWLAWGHMGTGLLSSWRCVPMGTYDDPLLIHLRRGQYERLLRFEGLGAGLFAGDKAKVNEAVKEALDNLKLNSFKTITDAINPNRFQIEQPTSIAHYDSSTISQKYPTLAQQLEVSPNKGRLALNNLINAHLQNVFTNTYHNGLAVLKPLPAHTSALIEPALHLAKLLAECPESPVQSSCPPNRPRCSPCVGSKLPVTTPSRFQNSSTLYTIGTVPHPYTLIALNNLTQTITVSHIRRHTDRDQWLSEVTARILGTARGGPSRVMSIKEAIASEYGRSRSLWLTVEHFPASLTPPPGPPKSPTNEIHKVQEKLSPLPEDWLAELDWHFGFPIPRTTISHGESTPPVPGPEREKGIQGLPTERKKSFDPEPPTNDQLDMEVKILDMARKTLNSKDARVRRIKEVAEAWNLADTEAWKFVRAFRARSVLERKQWEEEEAAFTGVKGKSRWWGS